MRGGRARAGSRIADRTGGAVLIRGAKAHGDVRHAWPTGSRDALRSEGIPGMTRRRSATETTTAGHASGHSPAHGHTRGHQAHAGTAVGSTHGRHTNILRRRSRKRDRDVDDGSHRAGPPNSRRNSTELDAEDHRTRRGVGFSLRRVRCQFSPSSVLFLREFGAVSPRVRCQFSPTSVPPTCGRPRRRDAARNAEPPPTPERSGAGAVAGARGRARGRPVRPGRWRRR